MDERDRLATSFGDMRRAMIPAFVLDLLATVDGGDELSMTQLATLYVLDAGEPVEDSNDLFGATVQMAARLCQAAQPEGILVSPAVRELVAAQFDLSEFGPCTFKGFAEPVTPYAVAWR